MPKYTEELTAVKTELTAVKEELKEIKEKGKYVTIAYSSLGIAIGILSYDKTLLWAAMLIFILGIIAILKS